MSHTASDSFFSSEFGHVHARQSINPAKLGVSAERVSEMEKKGLIAPAKTKPQSAPANKSETPPKNK